MATLTFQLYLTDTLTAIAGVSIAVWNTGETSVIDSGITDGNGQLASTLANATYKVKLFKDDYTIVDTTVVVSGDATEIVYGDAVEVNTNTYAYYKAIIINRLGGRNDAKTLALIMDNFNITLEFLATKFQIEDLTFSVTPALTASDNTYSFTDLGITRVNEIFSIRMNDGTQWLQPMKWISASDWDAYIAPVYPVEEGEPDVYTRRDENILFYTTPDDTYTINIVGTLYHTPVTGDASVITITNKDAILINLTTAHTWQDLQETESAATYFDKVDKLLVPYEQNELRKRYANSTYFKAERACLSK